MVLFGSTLVPLAEKLRVADPGLLFPFYVDDVDFDGLTRRSAQLLKLLMKRIRIGDTSLKRLSPSLSRTNQGKKRRQRGNLQWRD